MNRKALIISILAVALMFALVGCGKDTSSEKEETTKQTEQTIEQEDTKAEEVVEDTAADNTDKEKKSTNAPKSNSTSEKAKETHTHKWVAHTATRTVTKYRTETNYITKCNQCGANITGNVDAHMEANFDTCFSWSNNVPNGTKQIPYETTETYTDYYYCSCGARK